MKINLEGNRKLIAGSYALTLVFASSVIHPELFTSGETSLGWTIISIVGIIGGTNVMEWFAKRPNEYS